MHVELDDLGPFTLACVFNFGSHMQSAICRDSRVGFQVAVVKSGVSETVAEWEERVFRRIKISGVPAVGSGRPSSIFVIVVDRDLTDGTWPAQRQPPAGRSVTQRCMRYRVSGLNSQIPCL